MSRQQPPSLTDFLAPRHWPTWFVLGLFWIIAWLPLSWRLALGSGIGRLLYRLTKRRRYITEVNIRLCFPELSPAQQQQLVRQCFIENGIGLLETTTGWIRKPEDFRHMMEVRGQEKFQQALQQGRGVLLLGAHYTTLDFSANLIAMHHPIGVTFRPQKNPLFNAFMLRGRLRNCDGVFDRHDLRGAFRHLKQGKVLWYAPDQDYGPEHAVFAPFFGVSAATITAATRFARVNNSPVFVVRHHRVAGKVPYVGEYIPLPEEFPTGDDVADASIINQHLEAAIRMYPAQYLWMHRRFKTRPAGQIDSPYIELKTPRRKLAQEELATLCGLPTPLACGVFNIGPGLMLQVLPLKAGWRRRPVMDFDRQAKALKAAGLSRLTPETIYILNDAALAAVSFLIPEGRLLGDIDRIGAGTGKQLASCLARFHDKGFMFTEFSGDSLLWDGKDFHAMQPLASKRFPSSLCYADRAANVLMVLDWLAVGTADAQTFIGHYSETAGLTHNAAFRTWLDKLGGMREKG